MSCTKQSTKKYTSRPGPPFPAQNCRGRSIRGNDGKIYVSSPAKNGVYRWKLSRDDAKPKKVVSRKKSPRQVRKVKSKSPRKPQRKAPARKSRSRKVQRKRK